MKINERKFKRVFITGGAGYVGSALVPSMLAKDYEVVVYDLYIYGDVFKDIKSDKLIQVNGDIRDKELVVRSIKGCDAVIHLACISNDPSFILNPKLGKSINYDAFFNVLEGIKKNKVKRFVYASTSSVYGLKNEKDVREDSSLEPLTDYSRYKAECERLLKDSGYDGEWIIVRPATVCGYAKRLRLDLIVNILTIHALVNNKIKVFGGSQLRPNININDMVRIYELMLTAPAVKICGQTFNAGCQNMTPLQIAEIIKNEYNRKRVELEMVPTDDIRSYHINSDKVRDVLGFNPDFTINDAVRSLIKAFDNGLIVDGLNNPMYHNLKRMQELNLV